LKSRSKKTYCFQIIYSMTRVILVITLAWKMTKRKAEIEKVEKYDRKKTILPGPPYFTRKINYTED